MSRVLLITAVLVALVLNTLMLLGLDSSAKLATDFRVFWLAASAPLDQLYAPATSPFVNPPTALLWLKPLALFPVGAGFVVWTGLSFGLFYLAAVRLFSRTAALLALISPIAFKAAMLGQTTLILSAVTLIAFRSLGMAGGIALGVVASIKPQLLLLAPLAFIIRSDWRTLAGMAVGGAGSLLLQLVLFGPSLWADWLQAMPAFQHELVRQNVLQHSVSPAGYAIWHGLKPLPFLALGIALGVAAVAFTAKKLEQGWLAGLVVGSSAIAAPYSLPHDLVILAPIAAIVVLGPLRIASLPAMLIYIGSALPFVLSAVALWLGLREHLRLVSGREGSIRNAPTRDPT